MHMGSLDTEVGARKVNSATLNQHLAGCPLWNLEASPLTPGQSFVLLFYLSLEEEWGEMDDKQPSPDGKEPIRGQVFGLKSTSLQPEIFLQGSEAHVALYLYLLGYYMLLFIYSCLIIFPLGGHRLQFY